MTNKITTIDSTQLVTIDTRRKDQHPAIVYLTSLSKGSRRAMEHSLTVIAQILTRVFCHIPPKRYSSKIPLEYQGSGLLQSAGASRLPPLIQNRT